MSRQRFLSYVRQEFGSRPVVSPFLPAAEVVKNTLVHLGLPVRDDPVVDEIRLLRWESEVRDQTSGC